MSDLKVNKENLSSILIIYGVLFGFVLVVASLLILFASISHGDKEYVKQEVRVIDVGDVEPYTVEKRVKTKVNGRKRYRYVTEKKYKQDVRLEYDGIDVALEDSNTSSKGHSVGDVISVYVNKDNPKDILFDAWIPSIPVAVGVSIFTVIYWIALILVAKNDKE